MRRVFVAGMALFLCGAIAARSKTEPLVFVFLRVDREQDLALLRPMIAPDIGVQLDSGPAKLEQGTVLRCDVSARELLRLSRAKSEKSARWCSIAATASLSSRQWT